MKRWIRPTYQDTMRFLSVVAALALLCSNPALSQDPVRPYPVPDSYLQTTSFLDHESYVSHLDDPQWFLDNIPFVDFPELSIQDVYYYRTSVIKRHLKYAHEGQGWVFTEFIHVSALKLFLLGLVTDSL